MVRPILLAGIATILPMSVQGQGRAMMPAASHAVAAAPRAVAYAAQPARTVAASRIARGTTTEHLRPGATSAGRVRRRAGGTRHSAGATAFTSDFVPVPGLGFDMAHLAATRGPEAVGAGRHRRQQPIFFPFIDGGFFLPSSPGVVEEAAAPEAPEDGNAETEVAERPRRARAMQAAPAPPPIEEASAAPRQTEEFVFVRRDGTVFFAVAYAWENGTLRYVTSEGLRRSVARETLDLNATQQFNEQRGLNFRSPA